MSAYTRYGISTPAQFFKPGKVPNADPLKVDPELIKFGIHSEYHISPFGGAA